MRMTRAPVALLGSVLALAALLPGAPGFADDDHERARELRRSGAIVPLEKITSQVRERNIAHILEVELESKRDRLFYEVEGLDAAGVVHEFQFDATTGMMLDGPQRK